MSFTCELSSLLTFVSFACFQSYLFIYFDFRGRGSLSNSSGCPVLAFLELTPASAF